MCVSLKRIASAHSSASSDELLAAKHRAEEFLELHRNILNDLDELADIVAEMLERQEAMEVCYQTLQRKPLLTTTFEGPIHRSA